MKKITIILLALLLMVSVSIPRANAGAPKVLYELGDAMTDATISSIKARKGIKIEGIEWVGEPPPKSFSGAVKKEMQDVAVDSWETIKGKKFESTPLKDMPGWLKVTLGTTAFITGADIAFDIYEKVKNDNPVETITPNISVGSYTHNVPGVDVKLLDNDNGYKQFAIHLAPPADYVWDPMSTLYDDMGEEMYSTWSMVSPYFEITNISTNDRILYFRIWRVDSGGTPRRTSQYSIYYPEPMNWGTTGSVYTTEITLPKTDFETHTVPEIDTSREAQTLIVPDPEVYNTPEKMNEVINDNWDMVSDPEKFLKDNPQHDPDAITNPDTDTDPDAGTDPDTGTQPDSGYNEKSLLDGLTGLFVPSEPLGPKFDPVKDEMTNKFNTPDDFKVFAPALSGKNCPPDILWKGMKIVDVQLVCGQAYWWKPIMIGFMWFLFGWWAFRKTNALMAKRGGAL